MFRSVRAVLALPTAAVVLSGLVVAISCAPATAASATFRQSAAITTTHDGLGLATVQDGVAHPLTSGAPVTSTVSVDAPESATVTQVEVDVAVTHEHLDDVDLMLVSPSGQAMTLISDAGGNAYSGTLTLRHGDGPLGDGESCGGSCAAGPADFDTTPDDADAFPAPAPASAPASFGALGGSTAAGDWTLYAVDDAPGGDGEITTWTLTVHYGFPAAPSPSTLAVSGLPRGITDVDLTLDGVSFAEMRGLEVVLQSPDGRRVHVLSDAFASSTANLDLTLDDEAAADVPPVTGPASGAWSYRPVDYDDTSEAHEFVGGFDTSTLSSRLSTFDGADPNGAWRLYVHQEGCCIAGTIGGWSLRFATADVPVAPAVATAFFKPGVVANDVTITGTASPGAVVTVSENGHAVGTDATDGGGHWEVTLTDLTEGTHTFAITQTDAFGNTSAPSTLTIVVDTIAPTVTKFVPKKGSGKRVKTSVSPKVVFSEDIESSTLTRKTVQLTTASGKRVKAALDYKAATHTLVIDPARELKQRSKYVVTVKPGILDLATNPLSRKRSAAFRTR